MHLIYLNQDSRKLAKSVSFVSKFKAKHAIEEQNQCLEESQNCFESKVAEGFRFIDLDFLIEQLRRGCCPFEKYHFSRQLGFLLK